MIFLGLEGRFVKPKFEYAYKKPRFD